MSEYLNKSDIEALRLILVYIESDLGQMDDEKQIIPLTEAHARIRNKVGVIDND